MTAGTLKDYCGYGLFSALPVSPAITAVTGGSARYFATDTSTEYCWNGSAWVAVGGSVNPKGELGYTQITTASLTTTSTSLVDLTGVTVTVTIGSRPVVVSAYIPQWSHSTASGRALFALIDSTASAQIQDAVVVGDASNNSDNIVISARVNPSAGSRVFKVQYRAITAGTVTVNSGSTAPTYIQVVEV